MLLFYVVATDSFTPKNHFVSFIHSTRHWTFNGVMNSIHTNHNKSMLFINFFSLYACLHLSSSFDDTTQSYIWSIHTHTHTHTHTNTFVHQFVSLLLWLYHSTHRCWYRSYLLSCTCAFCCFHSFSSSSSSYSYAQQISSPFRCPSSSFSLSHFYLYKIRKHCHHNHTNIHLVISLDHH